MTISEPNPEVRPTGDEPAEFIEPTDNEPHDLNEENDEDVDPTARPSGSPPAHNFHGAADGPREPPTSERGEPGERFEEAKGAAR